MAETCTHPQCHLPVNMNLIGGVRDEKGRPWHDICLKHYRAVVLGRETDVIERSD